MEHIVFEIGLAIGLIAIAGFISQKLRFSIVPFYILIGMAVGPHAASIGLIDFRFIESEPLIDFMGRMGVLFLLFYVGLEFSVGRLIKAGRSIAIGGTIYIGINFTLGLLFGYFAGVPFKEILIIAGITTISSTAIVAKVLVDLKRTANPETEMILGMIMFDDLFLAVYLSIMSGLVLSGATSVVGVLTSALIALGYMLLFIIVGRKLVPLLNRGLNIKSNELFMLTVFAGLFLVAGFSETIHVAEAIGALLVGLVLAETVHMKRIEHMILPFRDFFGAMFFFSFGLSIDPLQLGGAVWLSLAAVAITLIGNYTAGLLAGRSAGLSARASSNIGLTITARGEFSILIANMGKAGGLLEILQPFTALYVLILAILGPVLTKESKHIHNLLCKVVPLEKMFQKRGATAPAAAQKTENHSG
ncbi:MULTISPECIES: cation:proton antiporter [Brevibacillus]|uniref:K(+)/H(+) antiporter YhaU n=1 Tax=Brevibacillus parabrevis TaxID=54914 RepID=A0A4Y3PFW7_BREPA|nr:MULTISPECIES: cation:proton antiporter [Brevibacillus]MBU8712400.1 cation:proton antiporter [Brevibacillus parabrevis]MDH6349472.1 CPA2 family monovalent cation:H+ antiporter-2 [Brevibacillus sp. 1238]MED1724440.1 cation:proton antiporter [Brevibacillus parabrevis]MED2257259.1 cation:proton antiporter [Brevibacillus parabrevis]NRQ52496.1 cation:proton antiporter [Brevibacillus sp. HD1.4A]